VGESCAALRLPRLKLPAFLACAIACSLLFAATSASAAGTGTIVYSAKQNNSALIFTMNADGSNAKQWGPGVQPTISRDGKTIVFARSNEQGGVSLWARNSNGANLHRLSSDPEATDSSPSISADGKTVVFLGDHGSGNEIFSIDIDGTDERQLTHGEDNYASPSVSANGKEVVFLGSSNGGVQVKRMEIASGDVTQLTKPREGLDELERPSFSPDGKKVVFAAQVGRDNEIYLCDAKDGSDRVQVTKGEEEGAEPSFSPRGNAIAFRRGPNIFTMALDGSGLDQLTKLGPVDPDRPFLNKRPSWGG
jgi:Tol biopolymer transport system component